MPNSYSKNSAPSRRKTPATEFIVHPIPPFYNKGSRILILGSFPSVKSREQGFFYGHPQNRFWKTLARVFGAETPVTVGEKKEFLSAHNIALWDVVRSCGISGSADSKITNVTANDISPILREANIEKIFVNGKKAYSLYCEYILPLTGREAVCLPSTSPANAAFGLEKLCAEWQKIKL